MSTEEHSAAKPDGRPRLASWNYRLTVQTCEDEEVWAVREIYYDAAGDAATWSANPIAAQGSNWLECTMELVQLTGIVRFPAFDLDTRQWCDSQRRPSTAKFGSLQ